MSTLPQVTRFVLVTGLMLGFLTASGCQQLSKFTRQGQAVGEPSSPTPDLRAPTPQLQPVPQALAPLPPPAPPSDAALLDEDDDEADFMAELNWEPEDVEVVADENEPAPGPIEEFDPQIAREFLTDRVEAKAQRFANEGKIASRRRIELPPQLPVIVPAYPELRRVSSEDPGLLPVPK